MPTVATLLLFCAAVLGLLRSTIALVFHALPGLAGGRVTVLRLLVLERPQHP